MASKTRKRKREDLFFPSASACRYVEDLERVIRNVILKDRCEYVVLSGPSGCGKSAIIDKALVSCRTCPTWNAFYFVALDGKLHGSPKASVDEILRQVGNTKTRPDGTVAGSIAEKLDELCKFLADIATDETTKKVGYIFVVENLEGLIEQKNQMLLYNLFDMAHSRNVPTCIIATSSIADVMEKMEKRVKSRFSHRVVNIASDLFVDAEEHEKAVAFLAARNLGVEKKTVEAVLKDEELSSCLHSIRESKNDWNTINRIVSLAYAHTTTTVPDLESSHFFSACQMLTRDPIVATIQNLPHLHLALLLSCFQYVANKDEHSFNFCMIEEIYTAVSKQGIRSVWYGRDLIFAAFKDLEDSGLLKANSRVKTEPAQFRLVSLNVSKMQLQEAVRKMDMKAFPTDLQNLCKDQA